MTCTELWMGGPGHWQRHNTVMSWGLGVTQALSELPAFNTHLRRDSNTVCGWFCYTSNRQRTKGTVPESPIIQPANMGFASAAAAAFSDLCKIWKQPGKNLSCGLKQLKLNDETWKTTVSRRRSSGRPLHVLWKQAVFKGQPHEDGDGNFPTRKANEAVMQEQAGFSRWSMTATIL